MTNLFNIQTQGEHLWEQQIARVRGLPEEQMSLITEFMQELAKTRILPEGDNHHGAGAWSWLGETGSNSTFQLPNDQAYTFLLEGGTDSERWNLT
jgi:hypothetical protein